MKTKLHGVCINAMILLAACLLACLTAEALVRLFRPQHLTTQYGAIWRPDDIFGWRHKENVHAIMHSGECEVHFLTDAEGFRINLVPDAAYRDAARRFSMLVLGDSFLEAVQVENRDTIPQLLKRHLIQRHPVDVAVTNAAVGGWNPNHYYLEAKRLADRRYDLAIVFLYAANDVVCSRQGFTPMQPAARHRFKFPAQWNREEIIDGLLYPVNDFLERRSHFFVLTKNNTKWLRMKLGLSAYAFPDIFLLAQRGSECWDVTAEVCESISDVLSDYDVPCCFVLLPANYQVDRKIFDRYARAFGVDTDSVDLEQPNKILGSLFEEKSLILLDPLEYMRKRAQNGVSMYGVIDSHFTRDGHEAVADYIAPVVESFL